MTKTEEPCSPTAGSGAIIGALVIGGLLIWFVGPLIAIGRVDARSAGGR